MTYLCADAPVCSPPAVQLEDSQSGSRPFMVLLEQPGGLLACCCADAVLGHFHIGCITDGPSRSLLSLALLR
jgi:hypothetical protein